MEIVLVNTYALHFHIQSYAPIQNLIDELNQKTNKKSWTSFDSTGKLQNPTSNWQTPQYQWIQSSTFAPIVSSTTAAPVISSPQPFFHQRFASSSVHDNSDLKVAQSQDSRRSENDLNFESERPSPKPLVIEYQPPFLHPILNENYTNEIQNFVTFTTETTATASESVSTPSFDSSTPLPLQFGARKTTKFFSTRVTSTTPPTISIGFSSPKPSKQIEARILTKPSEISSDASSTVVPTVPIDSLFSTPAPFAPITNDVSDYRVPPSGLLPPFETIQIHDDATTQGPPIYFQWKIPATGLEPPSVDDIQPDEDTSDGNQIPVIPPESAKPSITIPILEKDLVPPLFDNGNNQLDQLKVPELDLQPPHLSPPPIAINNDTDTAASNHSFSSILSFNDALQNFSHGTITEKSQTQRSIATSTANKRQSSVKFEATTKEINYSDLQKQFSIPEYTFPLETQQRPGYQNSDAVNSFQVKIPETDVVEKRKNWYGENEKCPECHPSFVKPGTCEPCIKLR